MDEAVSGAAQFTALYIGGQLLFSQILDMGQFSNPGALAAHQAAVLKTHIQQLLEHALKLQYCFVGLGPTERCAVKQFKMRVFGLNLVYVVKGEFTSFIISPVYLKQSHMCSKQI